MFFSIFTIVALVNALRSNAQLDKRTFQISRFNIDQKAIYKPVIPPIPTRMGQSNRFLYASPSINHATGMLYLLLMLDQFDQAENQNLLKELFNPSKDLKFPFAIMLDNEHHSEFSVTECISRNAFSIIYKAHGKDGIFVESSPVYIKVYLEGKHSRKDFFKDIYLLEENHQKSMFDMNNLIVVSKDISILLDSTAFDFESNNQIIKNLNRIYLSELPVMVRLGDGPESDFVVKNYLGRGSDGRVFEGYRSIDTSQETVLIKAYNSNDRRNIAGFKNYRKYFYNELESLKQLSRLIYADEENKVLVYQKVDGMTLDEFLKLQMNQGDLKLCRKLLKQYLKIEQSYWKKYGFYHNDVHPSNVIVDSNNQLHLIDFGKAGKLHDLEPGLELWHRFYYKKLMEKLMDRKKERSKGRNNAYFYG